MYEYRARIVKIVDGDTVDVDIDLGFGIWLTDERVRIMGIDTPESRTSDKVEKVFGKAFKDSTFQEQLQFIWWELNNTEKRALTKLKAATTAADAAALFDKIYERSDGKAREQRSKNAEDIYKRYENPSDVVDKEV